MNKWMNNNNFNKILALALGIILWAMVHVDTAPVSQTTVRTESKIIENVKIEITGLDEDKYVLSSKDAESVRLEVEGNRSDLTYKLSDAYKVTLDLSNVQPGDSTLPLSYSLPKGVDLVRMTPSEVNVHVELRNTKSFPITLITKGSPAEGYQLGTPVIQPTGIAEVTLPDSGLSKVAKVQGTIELEGENDTFKEKRMKLYAYDSRGNEIKDAVIEPSSVSVEIPITLPFKSVPLDIGFTGQLPGSLVLSRVTPEQDTVVVYGHKAALASLTSYEATINLSSIDAAGTAQLKVELNPPDGIEKIEPGSINVSVSISEVAERTLEGIPIKLEGTGTGLKAAVTDPASQTIALTLSGAPDLLNQLDRDKVSVVADVSGFSAGTHEVPLQVSLPKFISLNQSGGRLAVTVQLQTIATPPASEEPSEDTSGSVSTPEPSSEPVSGGATDTDGQPTHSADTAGTATPPPSEGVPENSGAANGSEGAGTNGNAGSIGIPGGT